MCPGYRHIPLIVIVEDIVAMFFFNADPGVLNDEFDHGSWKRRGRRQGRCNVIVISLCFNHLGHNRHMNSTLYGKLDTVRKQIQEYLSQSIGITEDAKGYFVAPMELKL
jgi:hypothetical protein